MTSPHYILQHYWGFDAFRPLQEEIIKSVIEKQDTVALLPTGGGKSLCFQIPALAQEGICIVISPLVALMTDQVKDLKEKGIKAMAITGGISYIELNTLLDNACYGNYKFLYLSPERLQQEVVQNAIKRMPVNVIAVDEAHCISQWGHDFRPAYQSVKIVKELHPYVPTIALTATATPKVLDDTMTQLELDEPVIFKNSFVRSNIAYAVKIEDDKLYRVGQLLNEMLGSSIIYVRSRASAEETSKHLNHIGFESTFYHGGLTSEEKKKRLKHWKEERTPIMVATNAFGMGIDHGNVRLVIHIQLPESLESYFQEAGRAGRDGAYAKAVIVCNGNDKRLAQKQFVDALPTISDIKTLYRKLNNYFQISYGEGRFTEHSFNFVDFCKTYGLNTMVTYNGLNTLDRLSILQLSKEFGRKSILTFLVTSSVLLKAFEKNSSFSIVGKTILRMYGGIFDTPNPIDLTQISKKMGIPITKTIDILKEMQGQNLLELTLFQTDASITFLVPREDDRTINPLRKDIEAVTLRKQQQVDAVFTYIEEDSICRQLQMVHYFGEENETPCGVCSVCASEISSGTKTDDQLISEKILLLLKETSFSSRSLVENLNFAEADILRVLQLLLDAQKIKLNAINEYYCKS